MTAIAATALEVFQAVCANPYARARAAAERGKRVAGYMNTYVPEELLHAAGYLPVRALGWTEDTRLADGVLQSYACSVTRSALNLAMSGELDFLDLMVFPHTCDTVQNLADIWQRNVPGVTVLTLATPVCTSGELAVRFMCEELERARSFLASREGEITDDALWESIRLYRDYRAVLRRLYEVRRASPGCVSGSQVLEAVLASFLMAKEHYLPLAEELVADIESGAAAPDDKRVRVFLAGNVIQRPEHLDVIEEAGCVVVDDILCTGTRAFAFEPVECDAPIESVARMYLARPPSSSKHRPGYDMGADVLERVRQAKADGVLFVLTKFCDPWAFDYPHVRETLEGAGVPSLLLEIEPNQPPPGQFQTRVAAFAEMLAAAEKDNG